MKKIRADELLFEKGLVDTRSRAKTLIMMGKVYANGIKILKAGEPIAADSVIEIKEELPYVSRGGLKLKAAIDSFNILIEGKIALDIGASTGGFTDCLLKHGAIKVYAVDVGYGLLDEKLRKDSRVINIEKTNFRTVLEDFLPEKVQIITIDVSFISLTLIIPKALMFLSDNGEMICLVKPQFELSPKEVSKGGVVKDPKLREKAVKKIFQFFQLQNLDIKGVIESPITGQKGNIEYLIYCRKQ